MQIDTFKRGLAEIFPVGAVRAFSRDYWKDFRHVDRRIIAERLPTGVLLGDNSIDPYFTAAVLRRTGVPRRTQRKIMATKIQTYVFNLERDKVSLQKRLVNETYESDRHKIERSLQDNKREQDKATRWLPRTQNPRRVARALDRLTRSR